MPPADGRGVVRGGSAFECLRKQLNVVRKSGRQRVATRYPGFDETTDPRSSRVASRKNLSAGRAAPGVRPCIAKQNPVLRECVEDWRVRSVRRRASRFIGGRVPASPNRPGLFEAPPIRRHPPIEGANDSFQKSSGRSRPSSVACILRLPGAGESGRIRFEAPQ